MASTSRHSMDARYHAAEVILSGAHDRVHQEAQRILRQFAASEAPFQIAEDRGEYMVLKRR